MNDKIETTEAPVRRGGWPKGKRRTPLQSAAPEMRTPLRPMMRAKPNWENYSAAEDSPDRLKIAKEMVPEGMDLLWVTNTVYGQPQASHRAGFERKGWTPVHQEDFEGRFDGMFMPKGAKGEITVEACVLVARPKQFSDAANRRDEQKARDQVQIKERALRSGDIPGVGLDAGHESALRSNKITKTVERIEVPND